MTRAEESPLRVVIAGAGVAGLETMIALRDLAGSRVELTVIAPESDFVYRALSVAEPFGVASVRSYPLDSIAADFGATLLRDSLGWVATRNRRVFLESGDELGYDALVIALGTRPYPAWRQVPTFCGPKDVQIVRDLLAEVEARAVTSVGFLVPSGVTWPFPLYELTLMLTALANEAGIAISTSLFTPEAEPLEVFGPEASAEVTNLLTEAGVWVTLGVSVEVSGEGEVLVPGRDTPERFERLLAIPRLDGPAPRGLPWNDDGFIPVDPHGLVHHVEHVYAAGDGTDYPVKQGGIATQQADAVAEVIAKRAGARVTPRPVRPVLRGHLLADGSSRFLRGELHPRDGGASEASSSPMWWPAGKIAGTYLSPYLAALDSRAAH